MGFFTGIAVLFIGYLAFKLFRGFLNPSKKSKNEIKKVYKQNVKRFDGPSHQKTTAKTRALSETLKSWCKFRNNSYLEGKVDIEVLPFVLLDQKDTADVFAEYLTYRDGTHKCNKEKLEQHINKVIRNELQNNSIFAQKVKIHQSFNFKWVELLSSETKEKLFRA